MLYFDSGDGEDSVKITAQRLPESRVLIEIEVDPERLERAMNQAYRRVVNRARIPGFRPGKAPRVMVERFLGRDALLHEALDRLVPEVYEEAIKQEGIEPIDQPDLEMPQLEPVIIKATVPVQPVIDLGDYRAIRVEPEEVTVDEAEIDTTIEQLRRRYATIEPVERPAQAGDLVRIDLRAVEGETERFDYKDIEIPLDEEQVGAYLPLLADQIAGMERGQTREVSVDVPEGTGGSLAGMTITYTIVLHDIKEEKLPELDEEFSQQVGEGFPTMLALRERLRSDARQRLEAEAKGRLEQQALDRLVEGATLEFPSVLIDREVERMLRERTAGGGDPRQAMQRYLARVGKSEDELRAELRPDATERVKRSLALQQLTQDEGLEVDPADVETEIDRMVGESGDAGERVRTLFQGDSGADLIRRTLLTRLAYERLGEVATGKAPTLAAEHDAGEASDTTDDALVAVHDESEAAPLAAAVPDEALSEVAQGEAEAETATPPGDAAGVEERGEAESEATAPPSDAASSEERGEAGAAGEVSLPVSKPQ